MKKKKKKLRNRNFFSEIEIFYRVFGIPGECPLRIESFIKIGQGVPEIYVPDTQTHTQRSLLLGFSTIFLRDFFKGFLTTFPQFSRVSFKEFLTIFQQL